MTVGGILALVEGAGANDAVTAVLALLVASMLRVIWSLQQRVSRLEGLDEYRERAHLDNPPDDDDERGNDDIRD